MHLVEHEDFMNFFNQVKQLLPSALYSHLNNLAAEIEQKRPFTGRKKSEDHFAAWKYRPHVALRIQTIFNLVVWKVFFARGVFTRLSAYGLSLRYNVF